jgi:hypothetical protein
MTIPEIAAQLRMVLGFCAKADTNVSAAQRIYFADAQNDCSDEQIISFWLTVSGLEEHQVPMFVARHWAKRASNFIEWMALLEDNTAPPGNNWNAIAWDPILLLQTLQGSLAAINLTGEKHDAFPFSLPPTR